MISGLGELFQGKVVSLLHARDAKKNILFYCVNIVITKYHKATRNILAYSLGRYTYNKTALSELSPSSGGLDSGRAVTVSDSWRPLPSHRSPDAVTTLPVEVRAPRAAASVHHSIPYTPHRRRPLTGPTAHSLRRRWAWCHTAEFTERADTPGLRRGKLPEKPGVRRNRKSEFREAVITLSLTSTYTKVFKNSYKACSSFSSSGVFSPLFSTQ